MGGRRPPGRLGSFLLELAAATEHRVDITGAVQDSQDLDSLGHRPVEDQHLFEMAYSKTPDTFSFRRPTCGRQPRSGFATSGLNVS